VLAILVVVESVIAGEKCLSPSSREGLECHDPKKKFPGGALEASEYNFENVPLDTGVDDETESQKDARAEAVAHYKKLLEVPRGTASVSAIVRGVKLGVKLVYMETGIVRTGPQRIRTRLGCKWSLAGHRVLQLGKIRCKKDEENEQVEAVDCLSLKFVAETCPVMLQHLDRHHQEDPA